MLLTLTLLGIILYILVIRSRNESYLKYDCFLLSLPESRDRRKTFMENHHPSIPIDVVYGINTKVIENAEKFQQYIDPKYYRQAIAMHYNKSIKRPDITYFNLGAIGAYMGHINIMKKCIDKGVKYALIFEDNVTVKNHQFYTEVQDVIDVTGGNFEMCFFHCLSRKVDRKVTSTIEEVSWVSSMKCYLINVKNMEKYINSYFPMDNHVDNKTEDIIALGARVYYKDLRDNMEINRTRPSTIAHHDHGKKNFFSRQNPNLTPDDLEYGY